MPRLLMNIAYDGSYFYGWQKQPSTRTVQGVLEEKLSKICQKNIGIFASGRTDTGVHAENQFVHFDIGTTFELKNLIYRLQRMVGDEIYIKNIRKVPETFHARFDARWREYRYRLLHRPDPHQRLYSWFPGIDLDFRILEGCLKLVEGKHDFSAFCRKISDQQHPCCEILCTRVCETAGIGVDVHIRANRFIRSMVRGLVGASVQVARQQRSEQWFMDKLAGRIVNVPVVPAPAQGLYLYSVFYPDLVF